MDGIYLKAFLVAVLEGLTEFIPVSSTGHMILLGEYIGFKGQKAATFEVFIQLGAILAVTLIYKDKFLGLLPKWNKDHSPVKNILFGESRPTALHFIVALAPVFPAGFLLHGTIKEHFSAQVVAIGLIVGGIMMIIVEKLPIRMKVDRVEEISLRQAFIIGVGQCMALWPGMSRSGSTMITSLAMGIKHKPAADFSFMIAVPVMCGAVGLDMIKSMKFLEMSDIGYFSLGFVVAFIVAWASIKWFLSVLNRVKLLPFGIYRIILGGLTLWLI